MGRLFERTFEVVIGVFSAIEGTRMEGRIRTVQLVTFAALCVLAVGGLVAWLLA